MSLVSYFVQLNEKLATVVQDALAKSQDPDRSPSPPPRYDGNGVRTNTRDVRMREGLNKERSEFFQHCPSLQMVLMCIFEN